MMLLLLAVVVDVVVVVIIVLKKLQILKDRGGDRSSDVRMLFEDDPASSGHPLHIETLNKQGACVLKIKCCTRGTLISYHNCSWTYVATHILSHNIGTPQDIATAVALASECEANGGPFPLHKLPTPSATKQEPAGDIGLMQCTFATLSYRINTQPFHRIKRTIANWIAANCLPYRIVEMRTFRAMTRSLDLKCPDFRRKAMTS